MVRAYTYQQRGLPDKVLQLTDTYSVSDLPEDHVRVAVDAVGLNPVDWKLMAYLPRFVGRRPALACSDFSGTVVESSCARYKPGDAVYGIVHSSLKLATGWGSLAEEIVAPGSTCALRPASMETKAAAGLSLVGLTAVVLANQIKQGTTTDESQSKTRILVCGGGSSVGLALVPILHHRGYHVTATCSAAKANLVRSHGADVTFDYTKGDLPAQLKVDVQKNGAFAHVLDCADAFDVWQICGTILQSQGRYVNVGMDLSQGVLPVLRRSISYFVWPAWLGGVARSYHRPKEIATAANMDELSQLVNEGVVRPLVDSTYPFEQTVEAFARLMSNKATGKVIVTVK